MSFRRPLEAVHPHILTFVALDLPGLLFFSTYSLLVLFWAEIYHQVRNLHVDGSSSRRGGESTVREQQA
jgi:hypothetical protein